MKDRHAREKSGGDSAECKFKKVRPNLRLGAKEVDALIQSLEARGASHGSAEKAESRPAAAAESVVVPADVGIDGRMSDEDFEDVALVLKMTRSASNARQCGLRILAEARRAREAEERLTTERGERSLEKEAG